MPREQTHEVELSVPPSIAFELLVRCSHLREWWSTAYAIVIPQEGGTWTAAWGADPDRPDYVTSATISKWQPGRCLELSDYHYYASEGPLPFEPGFTTRFDIKPGMDGCRLVATQSGFPDDPVADDYFKACDAGWQRVLQQMTNYAERF